MTTTAPPAVLEFTVHSHEADPAGRLTVPALCAYLQEAARRNAEEMGAGVARLAEHGLAWVLSRLRVEVFDDSVLGERLAVTTWARAFDRVIALRDFEVHDVRGTKVAGAASRWVVLDLEARRVARLPTFIRELVVPDRPRALDGPDLDLEPPESPTEERRFEVRRSDLDLLRHVNNTRYVEWAMDAVPDDASRLRRLEIAFRRESVYGDTVLSRAAPLAASDDDRAFAHVLVKAAAGDELAVAARRWERRPPASSG